MNGGFFRSTERATKYTHNDRVVFKAPVLGYPPHVVADCGPQVREFCIVTMGNGKPCKKCGTSEWYSRGNCKKCRQQQSRKWNENNRDKVREYRERWVNANQEKLAESHRKWRRDNPDKHAEYSRRARQANPGYHREWQQSNPAKVNAAKNRRRTKQTQAGGSYTAEEWKSLCAYYGNKCLRCGRDDVKLAADHVIPVSKGGSSNIDNIQPLCKSCNSVKRDKHIDYRSNAGPFRWLQAKLFG